MDGIGGCVKYIVYRAVMAGCEVIKTPEEFAKCADRLAKGVHCVYQPIEEMLKEPPYSTNMQILKVHKAHRVMTRNSFHCMQLYFIATDGESFHNQRYKKNDGTEPCGHFDIVGNDRIDTICAKCFDGENGEDWLVNGNMSDTSMFEFMTFVLKFGIFHLIMFQLGIFMLDGHFRFLRS